MRGPTTADRAIEGLLAYRHRLARAGGIPVRKPLAKTARSHRGGAMTPRAAAANESRSPHTMGQTAADRAIEGLLAYRARQARAERAQ